MVALRREKDLRLVHEPPEGFAVDNAVGVALITGTRVTVLLRVEPPLRLRRLLRQRRKLPVFLLLQSFPNGHDHSPISL